MELDNRRSDIPVRRREFTDDDLGVDLSQEMANTFPDRREYSRRALQPAGIQIMKTEAQRTPKTATNTAADKVPEPFYIRNKVDV